MRLLREGLYFWVCIIVSLVAFAICWFAPLTADRMLDWALMIEDRECIR